MKARGVDVGERAEVLLDNKMEIRYGRYLDLLEKGGEIARWWPKPMRLRIGTLRLPSGKLEGVYYTPDFMVQLGDGTLELHETKGHMKEAARVRLAVVADRYPYVVKLIKGTGGKSGIEWTTTTL